MNIQNLFKIAWRALLLNKTRAMLTMLGIIIGVGSVITMLAIGEGSKKSIKENISKMGTNMLNIRPGGGYDGRRAYEYERYAITQNDGLRSP